MKKLLLALSIFTLSLVGCAPETEYDDGGYSNVYAGIQIYQAAFATNVYALDAGATSFRLAILLEEMEKQNIALVEGSDQKWDDLKKFTFELNEKAYNIKDFLFGASTQSTISKAGNVITVQYGSTEGSYLFGRGIFDTYYRSGKFAIDTKGLKLDKTDINNRWTVTLGSPEMKYGGTNDAELVAVASRLDFSIYYDGEGDFVMESVDYGCNFNASPNVVTDWYSLSTLNVSDYTSLAVEDIRGAEFSYTIAGDTMGEAINGLDIQFSTGGIDSEVEPLVFIPSKSGFTTVSGVNEAVLSGEYSKTLYPSPYVHIDWNKGYALIDYNGTKYNTAN